MTNLKGDSMEGAMVIGSSCPALQNSY
jgi:hypothetical protein